MAAEILAAFERFSLNLASITTAAHLAEETIRAISPTGLDTVMAGGLASGIDPSKGQFYFNNWPAKWRDQYRDSLMVNKDPLLTEARLSMVPFTWSELRQRQPLDKDFAATMDLAIAWGWSEGLAVPIHGPGAFLGLVSFCGHNVNLDPLGRAVAVAVAHASFQRGREIHAAISIVEAPALTPRELLVMRLVASGKTDPQIAETLGIAPTTARFHVDSVKQKFETRSRTEAIGKLVRFGLI